MEFGEDKEKIRLLINEADDDGGSGFVDSSCSPSAAASSSLCICRICHEEEEERSTTMESPCACCGTLKFAHRECIQRWCDEKGSNVCEICLQLFEPNYTFPEKKAKLVDEVEVTIRESVEIPRPSYDPESLEQINNASDSYSSSQKSASLCRAVAITLMIMLLIRHFFAVVMVEADEFAFGVLTMFLLRACGILLPFYLVMRFISALQRAQLQYYQLEHLRRGANLSMMNGIEELQQQIIQIHAR